jgi:RHS repeat-associated protein
MNIIGRPTSDTLKSLQFNTMTLEQAYPNGGGAIGGEMPQIGEDPGGYPSQPRILYWYHPDYIQNVDLVTDLDGEAYELFLYNPWGEQLHHWSSNSSSWTSPYRFNAKEVDPETGLAYYGARYYQNKIGVWLSVDPLAHLYSAHSPYVYVLNNPISLIDPTGMGVEEPGLFGNFFQKVGNWVGGKGFFTDQQLANATQTVMLDEVTVVDNGGSNRSGYFDKQLYREQSPDGSTALGGYEVGFKDGNSKYSLSGFNVGHQFGDGKASVEVTGLNAEISGETPTLIPIKSSLKGKVFHAKTEVVSASNRFAAEAGAYAAKAETSISVGGIGLTFGGSFASAHAGVDVGAYARPDGSVKAGATGHFGFGVGVKVGFSYDSRKFFNMFK